MSTWITLSPSLPGCFDGIGDNAWNLARALSAHGRVHQVARPLGAVAAGKTRAVHSGAASVQDVEVLDSWRELATASWRARARAVDGVVVHYFPPAFLHHDLPALVRWLETVTRAGRPVVLAVHEIGPAKDGRLRRTVIRALYRQVLLALLARTSQVIVTTDWARRELASARLTIGRDVRIVPIGSNISRVPATAPPVDHTLVMFGQPGHMYREAIVALGRWLATHGAMVRLTWLGRSTDELRAAWCGQYGLPAHRVTFDGGLPEAEVSARLSAASIGLAPYDQGLSTRRSSLAALVEHALPIVGLDGPGTDDLLRQSGAFMLSPLTDADAFVRNVAAVLTDEPRRRALAQAAERLFTTTLSWPRIADAYLAALTMRPEGV